MPTKKSSEAQSSPRKIPRYCLHKATGQGVIYIARREIYLGPYGTESSLKLYSQIVARWQAGGIAAVFSSRGKVLTDLTIVELVSKFIAWTQNRYACENDLSTIAVATKRLLRLHADTPVRDFGPLALQEVRTAMIADDLCRNVINSSIHRIRWIWRWGVRNEMVDESLWRALGSVPALAEGEEGVRETDPVKPASWRQVRAVLRYAPEMVRVMVKLQALTGMRPGEVCKMQPQYITRSPEWWLYRPPKHKTKSKKKHRIIQLGPRAVALLEPLLPEDPRAFIFDPSHSLADYNARRTYSGTRPQAHDPAHRQARRQARGAKPRAFHKHYTVSAYRNAIRRACERVWPLPDEIARRKGESAEQWRERLGPDAWQEVVDWRREHLLHPHQLRHSFATRIGNRYGEEEAQVLLGHSRLQTTAIYVQRDIRRGRKIITQVG